MDLMQCEVQTVLKGRQDMTSETGFTFVFTEDFADVFIGVFIVLSWENINICFSILNYQTQVTNRLKS